MSQRIYFQAGAITLDLPESPPIVVDGWSIAPVTPPQVAHSTLLYYITYYSWENNTLSPQITKAEANQFKPELDVPGCSLKLRWTGGGELRAFSHRVTLLGAQSPKDYFYICYYPEATGEAKV